MKKRKLEVRKGLNVFKLVDEKNKKLGELEISFKGNSLIIKPSSLSYAENIAVTIE